MTPFTDDDLKRLKKYMTFDEGTYLRKSVEALIARLEASESLIPWIESMIEIAEERLKVGSLWTSTRTEHHFRASYNRMRIDEIKSKLEAWRKAKGEL